MALASILIAEQDGTVSSFLEKALCHQGYRVLCAADGHRARIFFDRYAPELALMLVDTVLCDGSGVAFAKDLPTRTPRIPIIFLSGSGEGETAPALRTNFLVMQKPFTFWQLIRAVKEAIARFYLDARSKGLALGGI